MHDGACRTYHASVMPKKVSAGILLFRRRDLGLEVLLGHPGGPFWSKRDAGAWSIPKGELSPEEDPLAGAIREFEEETGYRPSGEFIQLPAITQAGGKLVLAWAVQGDLDPSTVQSNTFSLEWPPRSGKLLQFPELDRAEWFSLDEARIRLLAGQRLLLDALFETLKETN
jgi:predicted NUDIX family NTP pyrophosphohydrolase